MASARKGTFEVLGDLGYEIEIVEENVLITNYQFCVE